MCLKYGRIWSIRYNILARIQIYYVALRYITWHYSELHCILLNYVELSDVTTWLYCIIYVLCCIKAKLKIFKRITSTRKSIQESWASLLEKSNFILFTLTIFSHFLRYLLEWNLVWTILNKLSMDHTNMSRYLFFFECLFIECTFSVDSSIFVIKFRYTLYNRYCKKLSNICLVGT